MVGLDIEAGSVAAAEVIDGRCSSPRSRIRASSRLPCASKRFGMIRALAGEEHAPIGAADYVEAPPYEDLAAAMTHHEHATLDLAADDAPTRLYCNLGR